MSTETHPNLHAVGLETDIYEAIRLRIRGDAKDLPEAYVMSRLNTLILEFVLAIDCMVDDAVTEFKASSQSSR